MGMFGGDAEQDLTSGQAHVVIDREVGTSANKYLVTAPGGGDVIPKQGYHDLLVSAAVDYPAFEGVAVNVLPSWSQYSATSREDLFDVFRGDGTPSVRVHRQVPPINNQGPTFSMAQNASLSAAAGISQTAFNTKALSVLGQWWPPLQPGIKTAFWKNYLEA